MNTKRELILPRTDGATEAIETMQSLLFIGANGSGKTRLGTWIEIQSPQKHLVHRISAQKSLSMPDSTTPVAIDLAENNLHKSVQAPLWAEVEKLRSDCLFIYLTHDVDFAAAQEGAARIWLKSFDGTSWEWEAIQPDENLPDDLLLEVLGTRKPVVFVVGENGSYDVALYREILPGFLVVPRGSCSQVILSVRALKANPQLHHLRVFGIIDRDRRVSAEIAALETDGIFVLSVAEVENLFCTREIIELVSHRLARDPISDFQKVADEIFKRLDQELDTQVSLRVASEIQFQLSKFDQNTKGAGPLSTALLRLSTSIDVNALYNQWSDTFKTIIAARDYQQLLGVYNRKSLVNQAGGALGLKSGELPELVIRLARGECREEIRMTLKKHLGAFGDYAT